MKTETVDALGRSWLWPVDDVECRKVVFNWSKDLAIVFQHCRSFRTAVQAGGNMGVWPWLLAKRFQRVVTFEPDMQCFHCLEANLLGVKNVTAIPFGLWDRPAKISMVPVPGNLGAQSITLGGTGSAVTIDQNVSEPVDLIYLDIEGAEWEALHGAIRTIQNYKPVIAVEDKNLGSVPRGTIEKWLAKEFGYRVVARPHRDVVMACV